MVDGISLALGSIKSASEAAKALIELRDTAKIGEATIELQGKIAAAQQLALAAQHEQSALIAQIDDLKKKVVGFESWEREKQRYQLHKVHPGILIYRLKPGMENGETAHEICADCYNKGQKSFLHNLGTSQGLTRWKCNSCGFSESTGTFSAPQVIHDRGGWMGV